MGLRLCVLGSGSSGNCAYVTCGSSHVLVDAGLSGKETDSRLAAIGVRIEAIQAICLTHEHEDHTGGIGVLARRLGIPLYANSGTVEGVEQRGKVAGVRWAVFTTGSPFEIGDLSFHPFSVPHDAYDPVGFVVRHGGAQVGIVTDMGIPTELVRTRLRGCGALVLEANHDSGLLRDSNRPWNLKQRIAGHQGHLSNEQAGALLADVADPALRIVFLAHLSAECNETDLALQTVRAALAARGFGHVAVKPTYPDRPSEVAILE
jgi:phosphoribosyl 1,2-cyclic phosphodiesterase